MTATQALIVDAVRAGVLLYPDGDALKYKALRAMPSDLAERIKAHRDDLLALLRENPQAAIYTPAESRLLDDAGVNPDEISLMGTVKATFPEAVLVEVNREYPNS